MLDREPFLRTIFANPADDLPRLVFADWLDDHGDPAWAELIRVQCELTHTLPSVDRFKALSAREAEMIGCLGPPLIPVDRGFVKQDLIAAERDLLQDPLRFRTTACEQSPHWYGATRFTLTRGCIRAADEVHTLLTSPVTEYVNEFTLAGKEVIWNPAIWNNDDFDFTERPGPRLPRPDYRLEPSITPSMLNALIHSREAQRITVLDLRNNNLDNDALRALAKSPRLPRLERLYLSDGNTFRGRVWQQVLERFGPDVVE